ncbi:MAG: hypothetical protein HUK14_10935 [Muribaculaceae bacterium]|nr:hypothetical protein [Muribaculaceae bacterium]
MRQKFFIIIWLLICSIAVFAQERPGTNLGKSLTVMKREFPQLRYLRTDQKGDFYEDGYPEDGIALFFYSQNDIVIEECMICESEDGFPIMWYESMWKSFSSKYPNALTKNTEHFKVFNFGDFKINIISYSENGKNTALIVYELVYSAK